MPPVRRSPYTLLLTMAALSACTLQLPQNTTQEQPSTDSGTTASEALTLEPADITVAASSSAEHVTLQQRLLPDGLLSIGNPDARTVLTLATNHACAYCQEFHRTLMPLLLERYVRTGSVRLDILPLRLSAHPQSAADAALLYCAAKQERGMVAHDLLMTTDRTPDSVRQRLSDAGINVALFDACVQNAEMPALYEAAQQKATSLGLQRAPSYDINGTVYVGLPEYADVRGQVEEALQQ